MGGIDDIWCYGLLWVLVTLGVVLVYFLSCDVLVCVCLAYCARLAFSYNINKI
jgi:hypothetical protein